MEDQSMAWKCVDIQFRYMGLYNCDPYARRVSEPMRCTVRLSSASSEVRQDISDA